MSVTAKLRYLRIAPRKVRLVADLIRGKTVGEAQTILNFTAKKAAQPLLKLLKSAIASAQRNFHLDETNLYIAKITVDEGPKYKRWMPRARGQTSEIQKKTSHINIFLDEIVKRKEKPKILKKIKKVEKTKETRPGKEIEKVPKMEESPKGAPEEEAVLSGTGKSPAEQAKVKPRKEIARPKIEKGIKRMFRRKAF